MEDQVIFKGGVRLLRLDGAVAQVDGPALGVRLRFLARDPGSPGPLDQHLVAQQSMAPHRKAILKAGGPLSLAFAPGQVFDYFDEIRKILETATSDVFVVDPYMGAEFIGRYLPHIKPGTQIRLLAQQKITAVQVAVEQFVAHYGVQVELRKSIDLHDRFLFVDGQACYHSGDTFKDWAGKSPTILTQVTDAFPLVLRTYEDAWEKSKPPGPPSP